MIPGTGRFSLVCSILVSGEEKANLHSFVCSTTMRQKVAQSQQEQKQIRISPGLIMQRCILLFVKVKIAVDVSRPTSRSAVG